jgi:hypothetical protein
VTVFEGQVDELQVLCAAQSHERLRQHGEHEPRILHRFLRIDVEQPAAAVQILLARRVELLEDIEREEPSLR